MLFSLKLKYNYQISNNTQTIKTTIYPIKIKTRLILPYLYSE